MSTIRTTLLAVMSVAAIALATATSHRQTGTKPVKITGPSIISTAQPVPESKRTIEYYTVTLNQVVTVDTTIDVTDLNGDIGHPLTMTVHAGNSSGTFGAYGVTPGFDTLTASNANGSVSMDVSVTN